MPIHDQPFDPEHGKRLYQLIHDLSDASAESREEITVTDLAVILYAEGCLFMMEMLTGRRQTSGNIRDALVSLAYTELAQFALDNGVTLPNLTAVIGMKPPEEAEEDEPIHATLGSREAYERLLKAMNGER